MPAEARARAEHALPRPRDDIESLDYDIDGSTIFELVCPRAGGFRVWLPLRRAARQADPCEHA